MLISKQRFYLMWILAIIVLVITGTCQLVKATPYEENYSFASCQDQGDFVRLARNLVHRGCGDMSCKRSIEYDHEYLVRCVQDGYNLYYLVWPIIDKVMGPYTSEQYR